MRTLCVVAGLLLVSSGVFADDDVKKKDAPKTAKEKFEAIQKDRANAMLAFSKAYSNAKTQKEKNKVATELFPKPETFSKRYLQVAKDHPDDPVALKSLSDLVTLTRAGDDFNEALGILSKRHVKAKEMGPICQRLVYAPSAGTEKLMRQVLKENPHHDVKGLACFSLGRYRKQLARMAEFFKSRPELVPTYEKMYGKEFIAGLKSTQPADIQQETEKLFERVSKEFADIKSYRGTLGDAAKRELFEIRHLSVGKVAPDIAGEDIDGVKFKLSDYRGKVIVLDFWGDW